MRITARRGAWRRSESRQTHNPLCPTDCLIAGLLFMFLRRCLLENVKSFLDPAELIVDGKICIVIGPNGGGKTNLLDAVVTVLRKHIVGSLWIQRSPVEGKPNRHIITGNDQLGRMSLEAHSAAEPSRQQLIEIDLELTARDVANMKAMSTESAALGQVASGQYENYNFTECAQWSFDGIAPGTKFTEMRRYSPDS
jgi:putative ATP-dependent endonuclease of the OLD family